MNDAPHAISSILSVGLTDVEIGEMLKSKEIHFQGVRYKVQIKFPKEDDSQRLILRESWLFARHLCEKTIPPSSFLRMSEETLVCEIFKESNLISVSVKSDITGDMLYFGPLVKLFKGMDVEQAIEHVNEVFAGIVKDRFTSQTENNKIQSYDVLLKKVNELIMEGV